MVNKNLQNPCSRHAGCPQNWKRTRRPEERKFLVGKQGYKSCREHRWNELEIFDWIFKLVVQTPRRAYWTAGAHSCCPWLLL